ncbi:hypothetical protein IMG5_191630, partial [Ichthyophthirius multifiliis]
ILFFPYIFPIFFLLIFVYYLFQQVLLTFYFQKIYIQFFFLCIFQPQQAFIITQNTLLIPKITKSINFSLSQSQQNIFFVIFLSKFQIKNKVFSSLISGTFSKFSFCFIFYFCFEIYSISFFLVNYLCIYLNSSHSFLVKIFSYYQPSFCFLHKAKSQQGMLFQRAFYANKASFLSQKCTKQYPLEIYEDFFQGKSIFKTLNLLNIQKITCLVAYLGIGSIYKISSSISEILIGFLGYIRFVFYSKIKSEDNYRDSFKIQRLFMGRIWAY